jgi:hypothetical protein
MFAASITCKLLAWYFALRYGDSGPDSRPWLLGGIIGVVFGMFDILVESRQLWVQTLVLLSYLSAGFAIMHVYFRIEGVVLSVLTCAVGTGMLFIGIPIMLIPLFELH